MWRKVCLYGALCFLLAGTLGMKMYGAGPAASTAAAAGTPWSLDVTYVEACSCYLFCPCYTNTHSSHDFCEFNIAGRVNDGSFGGVSLKDARYWLAGDLGHEWGTEGKSPWLVITFDPRVPQEQRDALVKILTKIYPVEWGNVKLDESKITWWIGRDQAWARLANGNGEMVLEPFPGANGDKIVLENIKYWTASKNHGFVFHKSKVHRWNGFGHEFSYSGRNAFTVRIEAEGTL